ncbi:hypothetical protein [Prevotella dentasini]|uniref:hypothetical protein n=1 Tax=Prevotella dentasini TaxID=589537 RepID=UPI001F45D748|nr:hypothetical protein [Prevotella dentasini]
MKKILSLFFCLFLLGCKMSETGCPRPAEGRRTYALDADLSDRLPDQKEILKRFKDDIVVLECADFDFNTAPIAIGNRRYTLWKGWVYSNGILSHTITSEGLTEGVLIQDFPDNEFLGETGGYYKEDMPYVKMNLYRTNDSVWFMNRKYPIARENEDSVFSQLLPDKGGKLKSCWVFVGKLPARR